MRPRLSNISLHWKILLSTSIAITLLFAVTGWIVQQHAIRITSVSLEEEVRASFRAYESLWRSREQMLSSISLVLSGMSDVRAAFGTGDRATIRDTAGELWSKISRHDAIFLVTDPRGAVIASLAGTPATAIQKDLPAVRAAAGRFPQQAAGFMLEGGHLYQISITPVYVQSARGPGLLNVLVAGYAVDRDLARDLKNATGGSDFLFLAEGRVIASTLTTAASAQLGAPDLAGKGLQQIDADNREYDVIANPLLDVDGQALGELRIVRSFEAARQRIATLERNIFAIWVAAILAGLGLTYLLTRRILEPVKNLDLAASEIARGNYDYRVPVGPGEGRDELGRLAETFNGMCASIQKAREDLIRQERISTIGRLSSSIVHDLRNPLAAIYGGAEMLVDGHLSPSQTQRLAANIYRASRTIQEMLQDLVNVCRGKGKGQEPCRLSEVVVAAYEACAAAADSAAISVTIDIPSHIELPLERARMERVFLNLIGNAIEAMPNGGSLTISAETVDGEVVVRVRDTGPGISEQIRSHLFQPFVSAGKKNGLGLGLALSRQTLLDHGGDLSADGERERGACFVLRLPMA